MHKYDATYYHHIDRNFGPNPSADIAQFVKETLLILLHGHGVCRFPIFATHSACA